MHTFDVYWLWLCLCAVLVLLVGTKTKQQLFGVFPLHIVCKNQKLYFSESFRSVESFDPSCFFLVPFFLDGTAATMTTMTQNNGFSNTAFDELPFLFFDFCWPRGGFDFALLSDRICIYIVADRREVLCLVHKIEPKRQGFTLPLGRISLSFFSAECQLPLVVFEFEPVSPFDVASILRFFPPFVWLWVSFVLVRLCFVGK